jgi:leucyl/phenylalanyl-tRNA--protein transferase
MILLPGKVSLLPDILLKAYRNGVFPMAVGQRLGWFTRDPRGVIPLNEDFHVPRSVSRALRRPQTTGHLRYSYNQAFREVMVQCSLDRIGGTWISPSMIDAYQRLHRLGHAHSVEIWAEQQLVGGLYGVSLGGAFFGESIFSRESNAGKYALVALVQQLRQSGFVLLDSQEVTPLSAQFGAREIPLEDYLSSLSGAVQLSVSFPSGWASGSGNTSTRSVASLLSS